MKAIAENPRAGKVLAASAAGVILVFLAYVVAHGTLHNFALGIAVALAIPLCYLAIEKPLLFPFGLYAALVPFEDILNIGRSATINKLLGILACVAVLLALLRRGEFVKPTRGVIAWMAVAAWMGVSGFWTADLPNWQAAYITFASNYLLYALIAMMIAKRSDIEMLCTCIVVGGMAAAATALWPFMHGVSEGGRLILPSADPMNHPDPNRFAASLLLPLAILFAATLGTKRFMPLLANIGGLALLTITIVLTGSRSAMLAVVILFAYMVYRSRRRWAAYFLVGLGLVAIIPFAASIASRWSIAVSSGGAGRTDIWRVAYLAFKDHWIIGTGYGSFETTFDQYMLRAPLDAYIGWHRAPHDMLISVGVQLGVIGLALVIAAMYFAFRDLKVPNVGGYLGDLKFGLEGTLLAILVDASFLDVIETKFLWLLFIMIALLRSTLITAAVTEVRRRTACAALSSPIPGPISAPEISRV